MGVIEAFALDATSRAAAAACGAAPMAALLAVFSAAEELDGIRVDAAGLPPKVEQCRTQEEAQRWLAAARTRWFNKPAVDLRRRCLAALHRQGALRAAPRLRCSC